MLVPVASPPAVRLVLLVASAATCLSSVAIGQVPTAILREGDPIPSVAPTAVVTTLSNTSVNGVLGYGVTIRTDDGTTERSHIWAAPSGGTSPGVIWTNQVVGSLDQGTFEGFFGIDNRGSPSYSASCVDLNSGAIDLDTAWIGLEARAVEGEPITALPGKEWRFASRPGVTWSGTPYWLAGITDQTSGASEGNGLFIEGIPVLRTGDQVPGFPGPIDTNGIDVDFRVSSRGTHWIAPVDVQTGSSTDDAYLVIDGLGVVSNGAMIAESQPIASGAGGLARERWDNFDFVSITEYGYYFFTGDTDGPFAQDEFIARDGVIVYREGDTVDGEILVGGIEAADMNERGDIGYVWDIEGASGAKEALFLNGRLLLAEGDAIDMNGDGKVDPTATVSDFTGVSSLSVGEDKTVYVTADIDVAGTPTPADDVEVVLAVRDPCGSVRRYGIGCSGTGGVIPTLDIQGCLEGGSTITVVIQGGVGGAPAILLFGGGRDDVPLSPLTPDCSLLLANVQPFMLVLPLGGIPGAAGQGSIFAMSQIPVVMAQVGFTMQAIVADPQNPYSGAPTNGLGVEVGF